MARGRDQRKKQEKRGARAVAATVPPSDATSSREIRAAMLQIEGLLTLVSFPLEVESAMLPEPRLQHNWDLVAPAMLFSAAGCLRSIRALALAHPPRREQDAIVLLRRLYEHVVDFAWIAIDPGTNAKKWEADDYNHRLKIEEDFKKLGTPGLTLKNRASFEQRVKESGCMPTMPDRAKAADEHWSRKIDGHGVFPSKASPPGTSLAVAQGGNWSLRSQYAVIFKIASGNAHPTPMSLYAYIDGARSPKFTIGMIPSAGDDRYAYTLAPLVYATMLIISEKVLGFPKRDDVEDVFNAVAAGRRS